MLLLSYDDELVYDEELEKELLSELLVLLELVEDTDSSSPALASLAAASAAACASIILGAFLRNSRSPSVSGPSPIDVKKLIA